VRLYNGVRGIIRGFRVVMFFVLYLVFFSVMSNGSLPVALAADASPPTLSVAPNVVHPYETIAITGRGFAANEQVSIDFYGAGYGPVLTCNAKGTCTGKITVFAYGGVQGTYPMTGTGTQSGLQATLQLQVKPALMLSIPQPGASSQVGVKNSASLLKVGPGSTIDIAGSAFAASEVVQIYLGTVKGTLEGTTTTDTGGNLGFYFVLPTTMTPGQYIVTAARSQHPLNVVQPFEVVPPKMTSSAQINYGQKVNLSLHGFQAREAIAISWNANGGQQLGTLYADYGGNASTCVGSSSLYCIIPPSAPSGTYTLTATGNSSGLQATSNLELKPGLVLNPAAAGPGSTISVNGGGFTSGETVNVYFQTKQNGLVPGTVDPTGAFSVQLTVAKKYNKTVTYYVHAYNGSGTEKAASLFYFYPPSISVGDGNGATYGVPTALYGQGFLAGEKVAIYWNYQQTGQTKVTVAMADQYGNFIVTIITPSDPNLNTVNVAALGRSSKLQAISQIYEQGGVVLNPMHGKVGTSVTVNGGGYDSNEVVTVSFGGTTIATVTTNTMGAFTTTFVVPDGVSGNQWVNGTGGTSGLSFSVLFTIDP